MTKDKKRKKAVRERMQRTGESYTAANEALRRRIPTCTAPACVSPATHLRRDNDKGWETADVLCMTHGVAAWCDKGGHLIEREKVGSALLR